MITTSSKDHSSDQLKVAIVQPDIIWQEAGRNRMKYSKLLQDIPVKPDLILLPEMFSTGFCTVPGPVAEDMKGETVKWLRQTAVSMRSGIAGSLIILENDHFYNRLVCMDPQGKSYWYDKRHLFRMAGEEVRFTPGTKPLLVQLGGWSLSFQICYDLRFPVWSRSRRNIDLIVYASNWPASRRDIWNTLLKARAIENQCFVAGINRVGTDGNGIEYCGESMLIDPKGKIIALASANEEVIHASLSLQELNEYRQKFPVWKDWDDFQIIR